MEDRFTVDNANQSYINQKELGDDVLAIGPLPGRFGQRSIYHYLPVGTDELEVLAGPIGGERTNVLYVASPGDPVDITAHIDNAYDPTLRWEAEKGKWADSGLNITQSKTDEATKRLITPEDADDFGESGVHVTIESTSRTGLREKGEPRLDFVRVRLAPFIVDPPNGQVNPEGQLAYTATDRDGKPADVTWEATGGSIASSGLGTATYVAGRNIGTYQVTATRGSGASAERVTVPVRIVDNHCVVGTWELDSEPFIEALFAAAGTPNLELETTMRYGGGSYRIIVQPDGTTADVREDWTLTGEVEGLGTAYIVMNGTELGTWSVETEGDDPNKGTLLVETTGGDMNIEFRTSFGPVPFGNQQVPVEGAMGSGQFTCSPDTLEILVNADGHQIPVTWTRVSS